MENNHLFCFGYGYSCAHLGRDLLHDNNGWSIYGTTRDLDKKADLRSSGIKSYLFDFDAPLPDPLYMLRDVTHILISTPPTDNGDPTFIAHAHDIISLPNLKWVGYLSTTSSYGDRGGGWVDENSQTRPTTKRGSRRLKAENQWLSLFYSHNIPVNIFRLSGIYGPERSALDSVRSGIARRVDKPGHMFSRVHIDDIVQVLKASMNNPKAGQIYNICDDMPTPSHEVIKYACDLLGIEPPPLVSFDDVDLAPITQSFYADNKRVRNDKIKHDLGIVLKYPDYKSGLIACLESDRQNIKEHSKNS